MFKDYHFNKWTKDKEGEFFKIIGRFDCNFLKEITFVRKERLKTKRFNEQPYTYATVSYTHLTLPTTPYV